MSGVEYNLDMPWANPEPPRDPIIQKGLNLLGAAMRRARRRKGWTQRQLAERAEVHQSTISRFERGDRVGMRFSRFARIVAILDGLEFLPKALEEEPIFTTRRQWLEWSQAKEAEWYRRYGPEAGHPDDPDEEDEEPDEEGPDSPSPPPPRPDAADWHQG